MTASTSPLKLLRMATGRPVAIAIAALLVGGSVLVLLGRSEHADAAAVPALPASPATALSVDVITPQPTTLARTVAASGSIGARDELLIGSDANGVRLMQVLVDIGSVVKRGQLLARADDRQLQAQAAQLDAQIRQARAERAQADANLARAESVEDAGVYSVEALQTRRTAAESAAAKLELALAQRRELEVRIGYTRVLAPADGTIAKRSATVGTVVQPGLELFRLIADGELEWRAELPDHALQQLTVGAPVRVAIDDGRGLAAVDGRVRLVAPTVDARTRNGMVHVSLPRGVPLKAGGHAQGDIALGQQTMLTLPESVLFLRDGQHFVYVIGRDEIARRQRVDTGVRQRGLVEVRGLPADSRVVATGGGFVKDGERVRVVTRNHAATQGATS